MFVLHPEELNKYNRIVLKENTRILKPLNIDHINNANELLRDCYTRADDTTFTMTPLAVKSEYIKALSQRVSRQSGVFTLMSPIPIINRSWINHSFQENGRTINYGKVLSINNLYVNEILNDLRALDIYDETIILKDTEEIEKKCKFAVSKAKTKK